VVEKCTDVRCVSKESVGLRLAQGWKESSDNSLISPEASYEERIWNSASHFCSCDKIFQQINLTEEDLFWPMVSEVLTCGWLDPSSWAWSETEPSRWWEGMMQVAAHLMTARKQSVTGRGQGKIYSSITHPQWPTTSQYSLQNLNPSMNRSID
jgi:hypothetical protein